MRPITPILLTLFLVTCVFGGEEEMLESTSSEEIVRELLRREALALEPHEFESDLLPENPYSGFPVAGLQSEAEDSPLRGFAFKVLFAVQEKRRKLVYGDDDRADLDEVERQRKRLRQAGEDTSYFDGVLKNAESVAIVVPSVSVRREGARSYVLPKRTFRDRLKLCEKEPFANQPSIGVGTAFVVGPGKESDLVATAGHCVLGRPAGSLIFVFDYRVASDGKMPSSEVSSERVYRGKDVVGMALETHDPMRDWAIVRVDRRIRGRRPLKLRSAGKIAKGERVYVLGHPVGLPMKLADGAEVRDADPQAYFVANLDTYRGNSGSPVFNAKTHVVEGILVRGGKDFRLIWNNGLKCRRTVYVGDGKGRGEDVNRIGLVRSQLASGE